MRGGVTMNQKKKGSLNQKELDFCRLVIQGKTPSQAAKEAGYAQGAYGLKLVKKDKISSYIFQHQPIHKTAMSKEEKVAENEEILKFLTSIMRGDEYEEKKDSVIKDRMKAAELLGKRMNLFENKDEEENTKIVIMDDISTILDNRGEIVETKKDTSF